MTPAPKVIVRAMLGQRPREPGVRPLVALFLGEASILLPPETVDELIALLAAERDSAVAFALACAAEPALAMAPVGGQA